MNASAHIVEIDESNAQQLLIEESMTRPVVVDFWADWCGPCKQLIPKLEKLADEYQGAFLLAKVNADEQQMLAQQQRLRSCMYSALDSRPSRSHARDRSCSKAGSGKPGCAAPKASEKKPKDPSKKSLISSDLVPAAVRAEYEAIEKIKERSGMHTVRR